MIKPLLIACSLALLLVAPAAAEPVDITRQAKAARAEFLLTATPPGPAAAICLVDTGVNATPDTPGVVERIAVDGGSVLDQSPSFHGTTMAMYIGAPSNRFGMVGMWPSARIVSVRASETGQDAFTHRGYVFGLRQCRTVAARLGVKVAVLALSSETAPTTEDIEELAGELAGAQRAGINVVAAAGNTNGSGVSFPGAASGVISIGATSAGSGALCGFSARGARLSAPGCDLDGADAVTGASTTSQQGTSQAAAIAATALASLRTWRPDLDPDAAIKLLEDASINASSGRAIDLTAAFAAAGLGFVNPPSQPPSSEPNPMPTPTPTSRRRLATPKATVRPRRVRNGQQLTVRVANRPRGAKTVVKVYTRGRNGKTRRVSSASAASSIVRLRVRTWRYLTVRFTDPVESHLPSRTSTVRDRR